MSPGSRQFFGVAAIIAAVSLGIASIVHESRARPSSSLLGTILLWALVFALLTGVIGLLLGQMAKQYEHIQAQLTELARKVGEHRASLFPDLLSLVSSVGFITAGKIVPDGMDGLDVFLSFISPVFIFAGSALGHWGRTWLETVIGVITLSVPAGVIIWGATTMDWWTEWSKTRQVDKLWFGAAIIACVIAVVAGIILILAEQSRSGRKPPTGERLVTVTGR